MSLLDALAQPPARRETFEDWLAAQPKDIAAALEKAALDPRWSDHGLEKTLRSHGAHVSDVSIGKWRADLGFKG